MRLPSRTPEQAAARREAVAAYRDAHAALRASDARERAAGARGGESPEFRRLNAAAHQAAKNPALPWYLRVTGFGGCDGPPETGT